MDVSAGRVTWTAQLFPPDGAAGTTLDSVLVEAAGSAVGRHITGPAAFAFG